ncbi:MAG: M56 family metallopeptidase [Isosphaeraceae bacterium]
MLGWFVETTLVASGLAVVAALGGRLRSIGPTARHVLWLIVLVRLMTPPLVCWPWAAHWGDLGRPLISPADVRFAPVALADESPAPPCSEAAGLAGLDASRTDFRVEPSAIGRSGEAPDEGDLDALTSPRRIGASAVKPDDRVRLSVGLAIVWLVLTVLLGVGQASRIIRFRGRLRAAVPAPEDLVEEAERIGRSLGVCVPEVLVVPDLGTPMLWCLGRPKLLLPAHLVKTLDRDRWRGILTHELAHIRRGDHWVSRLELAAGLIWWWNPIYWLARARLDAEAELACDAWVVSTLPKDRLAYAEALLDICSNLSMARTPAPALGAAGSGRFFERRLTMILHGRVPCRLSPSALLLACLLALFALPSWSTAKPAASPAEEMVVASLVPTVDPVAVAVADDDDDDDADGDDGDDDDDDASIAKAKADAKQAEANLKKARSDAKKARSDAKKAKEDVEHDLSRIGKEIEGKFGPDFEKKMEELGEKIEKEIEGSFGPDFEKKMETLGEKIGKELEAKLGPGSDFEKSMKELGKEMETKFGPGSDFEKKIKEQAEKLASDFKKKAAKTPSPSEGGPKAGSAKEPAKAPHVAKDRQRERRIAALEAQIRKLADELKALKADDDRD